MATRRRRPTRQARRKRGSMGLPSFRLPDVGKDVARSLVGMAMLVLGVLASCLRGGQLVFE